MSSASLSELRISNDARDGVEELRRRLADDGYLFFRRLLDPLRLLHLRRIVLRDPGSPQGQQATSVLDAVAVRQSG